MSYKISKSTIKPITEKYPEWTKTQMRIDSETGTSCRIEKNEGLLPYRDMKVIISKTDLAFSLDGKPVYGVDKKEFTKLFNEFVNAVAGEFNINVEGYVADETQE